MSEQRIVRVTIVNRKDCCGEVLKNVEVRAGLDFAQEKGKLLEVNTVCGEFEGPGTNGGHHEVNCVTTLPAQFITVQKKEQGVLHVAEIYYEPGSTWSSNSLVFLVAAL